MLTTPINLNMNLSNDPDDLLLIYVLQELFNRGPVFMVDESPKSGSWKWDELIKDYWSKVFSRRAPTAVELVGHDVRKSCTYPTVIKESDGCFILIKHFQLQVICNDWAAGERLMDDLTKRYWKKSPRLRHKPSFCVIKVGSSGVETQGVTVQRDFVSKDNELDLYYGPGFQNFHDALMQKMKLRHNGVVVFRGAPGTGKTTYIRTMMWALRKKHRFVTVPLMEFQRMTSSECTHFWLERFSLEGKTTGVLVIEDAEALIRSDGEGRSPQLSTLLNLGDGLLGEHLKLHIILTVNCPIDEIDPALTRRGRLIGHHEFTMRTRTEALAIAEKHNLVLTDEDVDELSLSDIFAEAEPRTVIKKKRRPMGFTVSPIDEDVPF